MSNFAVDIETMQPAGSIQGDSATDTNRLREMATEAAEFVREQEWCERVDYQYLAYGVGGVVAIFLFQITARSEDVDSCLWLIVGDLPSAYIVVDDNPTATDALDAYCSEMSSWVEAVRNGESVDDLIPVNVPPTAANAEELDGRLGFLRSQILPLVKAC